MDPLPIGFFHLIFHSLHKIQIQYASPSLLVTLTMWYSYTLSVFKSDSCYCTITYGDIYQLLVTKQYLTKINISSPPQQTKPKKITTTTEPHYCLFTRLFVEPSHTSQDMEKKKLTLVWNTLNAFVRCSEMDGFISLYNPIYCVCEMKFEKVFIRGVDCVYTNSGRKSLHLEGAMKIELMKM